MYTCYAAKSLQLCLTLCDPIDSSLQGSPVTGILQARTLEWVAISFSNVWKWKGKVKSLSRVRSSATPWTAAFQAPPSMGFSRQEYWSGVSLPSPLDIMGEAWTQKLCLIHFCISQCTAHPIHWWSMPNPLKWYTISNSKTSNDYDKPSNSKEYLKLKKHLIKIIR